MLQRTVRYKNFFAFHSRWENDNTNAARDGESFEALVKLTGFSSLETYIIPEEESMPGFEANWRIIQLWGKAAKSSGRGVILVHYAEHSGPNNLN